ncbi:long-chain fatty acid--CoA ligase [Xanthobacter autotrophicus DSM 431]|uniref:long-chain fatty acid--CoA ligase n=1 Tax=Xanthobacter nonsaccharivorans TaxID=3119912 RepID=UPI00372B7234
MKGLMQSRDLNVSDIIRFASRYHTHATVTTRRADGSRVVHSYPEIESRAAQLAHALKRRGIGPGTRIGTLAWNDHRHLELYYGVAGIGAICHTINPRLFREQIAYIIADAADAMLFVDPLELSVLEGLGPQLKIAGVATLVVLGGDGDVPESALKAHLEVISYETLIAGEPATIDWPRFDENEAVSLCYTSGTTGSPKGVLYSHRAVVLHGYSTNLPDFFGLRSVDVAMPVVPMFHVNGWGVPYSAPMVGASLVLPGPRPQAADLCALISTAGVTWSAAVPTVWLGVLERLRATRPAIPQPLRITVGGAACPPHIASAFHEEFGITVNHAWGMTETTPCGLFNQRKVENKDMPLPEWLASQRRQGRPTFGVEMKVVDDAGAEVSADGAATGEMLIRGPWIAASYFKRQSQDAAFTSDGWFRTGDVVTQDASGYFEIVDRTKDLIKSGGEWISSIALENIAVAHPAVEEAVVIAARHEKWDERPLLLVVLKPGRTVEKQELLDWYGGKVAKWWVPDDVVFVAELPHTATGKLLKSEVRNRFSGYMIGRKSAHSA